MNNKKRLVNKFSKEVKSLEKMLAHPTVTNVKNAIILALLKSGIALDYALPYIMGTIIASKAVSLNGNAPFHIDEIEAKASIETIDTSSGTHIEHISFDIDYDEESIAYSTGWTINNYGLYERTITTYRLNKIDLSTNQILSLSKEELENIFTITNIKTICQETLEAEDEIYKEEGVFVVDHYESENETITRPETFNENLLNSLLALALGLCDGCCLYLLKDLFAKIKLRDELRKYESKVKLITQDNLQTLKKILEIKKQNLAMIDETANTYNQSNTYELTLRKRNDN